MIADTKKLWECHFILHSLFRKYIIYSSANSNHCGSFRIPKDIMANSNSLDFRWPEPENEVECQQEESIDPTLFDPTLFDPSLFDPNLFDPTLLDPPLVDLGLSPIPSDETWPDYTLPTIPSQVPYNTPDSQLFEIYADSPSSSPTSFAFNNWLRCTQDQTTLPWISGEDTTWRIIRLPWEPFNRSFTYNN